MPRPGDLGLSGALGVQRGAYLNVGFLASNHGRWDRKSSSAERVSTSAVVQFERDASDRSLSHANPVRLVFDGAG